MKYPSHVHGLTRQWGLIQQLVLVLYRYRYHNCLKGRYDTAMKQFHDVVIIGGGFVGTSLAIALEHSGLDVGLVECTRPGALPPVFDQRHLALSAATVNALERLGVMAKLHYFAAPVRQIFVSRSGDFGRVQLNARDFGRTSFGHVALAQDIGHALDARVSQLAQLTRYRPARCIGFDPVADGRRRIHLVCKDDETLQLHARLVVGCDGSLSAVRTALRIETDIVDYHQTLVVARVQARNRPDGTAWERFTATGPTALLPRGDQHYGAIHCVDRSSVAKLAAMEDSQWLKTLQAVLGSRVGQFLSTGPRHFYPLVQSRALSCIAARTILMGNAAQTIHPIGAQGFNLGLRDALTLAQLLQPGHQPLDPGGETIVTAYDGLRRPDREQTIAFSAGMARLTSRRGAMVHCLRSIGLMMVAHQSWLQAAIAGGAMGFRGNVPSLCQEMT